MRTDTANAGQKANINCFPPKQRHFDRLDVQDNGSYHNAHKRSGKLWLAAALAWITLILFSSTSLAAEYCERAFTWIYGSTVGKQFSSDQAYDWLHFLAEKSVHLTLFFVLGLLLWQIFTAPRRRRLAAVVLAGLAVGTASELLQRLFPGGDPAIRDVLINVVGTFLGAATCAWRVK